VNDIDEAETAPVIEFLRLLFAPCSEISLLASTALDEPPTRAQRVAVAFHCLYCKACRRYRRHVAALRHAIRTMLEHALESDAAALPADARERINRALSKR
jgi:predicted anti-sigma-YlaC factor YlaD